MKNSSAARALALVLGLGVAGPARAENAVRLLVALTWEGRDLKDHNLEAVRAFRDQFRDVSVVHFVSPAYFLTGDAGAAARIRSAMRPGDHVGLALGGWKSLAAEAQVIFRDGPTFWGAKLRPVDCVADCGLEVPLSVYPETDAAKLLAAGLATLEKNGFGKVQALATTGWVASPELLQAAAKAGIRYDFSAVAPEMIARRTARFPLFQWVKDLWAQVTPHSQPFPVDGAPGLLEVPQTTAAIDYLQPDEALGVFREAAELLKQQPDKDLIFPLAAYQETAFKELPRLATALQEVFAEAVAKGIALRPAAIPEEQVPAAPAPQAAAPVAH